MGPEVCCLIGFRYRFDIRDSRRRLRRKSEKGVRDGRSIYDIAGYRFDRGERRRFLRRRREEGEMRRVRPAAVDGDSINRL